MCEEISDCKYCVPNVPDSSFHSRTGNPISPKMGITSKWLSPIPQSCGLGLDTWQFPSL